MAEQESFTATEETFRAMARVVLIDDVLTHPNADRLELAIIGGWQVVIVKGAFKKGDKALYCEIDSLVPTSHPEFSFLEIKGENIKTINEVTYCRIKTIRLRKELSQGLLVPVPAEFRSSSEGTDLSKGLGVLKYEKAVKTATTSIDATKSWFLRFASWIFGVEVSLLMPWPSFLNKSEQPRIQNINSQYAASVANGEEFEETVKLDGNSMTVYSIVLNNVLKTGVCSRNCEISQEDIVFTTWQACRRWLGTFLARNRRFVSSHRFFWPSAYESLTEGSKFKNWVKEAWSLNKDMVSIRVVIPTYAKRLVALDDQFLQYTTKYKLLAALKKEFDTTNDAYAVQGELVGPGIQDNFEGLDNLTFFAYQVYIDGNIVKLPDEARLICERLGFLYVPVNNKAVLLPTSSKELIKRADGPRALAKGGYREGLVYKSRTRDFSFKCVSNKYLEKEE